MDQTAVMIFETLRKASETMEGKALYILAVVCVLMIVDFITGSLAAWRSPKIKFCSQEGINGILRKLASIIVLVVCIPVAVLIPAGAGLAALIVLYVGYMLMEFASIIENLEKLGVPVKPLSTFVRKLECEVGNKCDKEENDNGNEE